jgi:hypothetical protein
MMILAAIFILSLISVVILGLNRLNIRPGYFWFLSVGGSLIALFLVVLSRPVDPVYIDLMGWESSTLFFTSPGLLLDNYSWPYAVAVVVLLISVLLTDVTRSMDIDPAAWGADLAISSAGLLAVLASNPLTLLLSWAILDLAETIILLTQVTSSKERERVVVSFSVRVVGILLVVSAIIRTQIMGMVLEFSSIPSQVSGYLILAAGLRLGVLPPHQPFLQESPLRRGLGTLVRLIPVSASLLLLTRVATVGASPELEFSLMSLTALALIFGGIGWILSRDELDGRPFWIFGMSSLSVLAAVRGLPSVSQAWGLGLIFSGGLLFLYSARNRRTLWLPALGLVSVSGFPFTPTWRGATLFLGLNLFFSIIFVLGFSLLLLGYFRHMARIDGAGDEIQNWSLIIYPLGLVIILLTHLVLAWDLRWLLPSQFGSLSIEWWLGIFVLSLGVAIIFLYQRSFIRLPTENKISSTIFSFGWFYQIMWWIYRLTSRLVGYMSNLMEGEGGIMWAVLIMILLVTLILQRSGGG